MAFGQLNAATKPRDLIVHAKRLWPNDKLGTVLSKLSQLRDVFTVAERNPGASRVAGRLVRA